MSSTDTLPDGRRLHAAVRAIVRHLPEEWRTVETPYDHGARVVGPDGAHFYVRLGTYGAELGRLLFTAGTPDGAEFSAGDWHGVDHVEMTAASGRDPAAIARDIVRKLIPGTLARHAEITGRIVRRTARANAVEAAARELAGRMGTTARERRGDWRADTPSGVGYGGMTPSAYGDAGDDVRVTVELRGIPMARACELAELIRGWGAEQ
jgi:hypothetical protein